MKESVLKCSLDLKQDFLRPKALSLKKLKKFIRHFVDRLLNCHVLFLWAITTSTEALRSQIWISSSWCIISVLDSDCKLVRYFQIVSECKTVVYFSWSLTLSLAQPVQLFWRLVTFGITSNDSLTDSDLQMLTETDQEQRRHSFIQYSAFLSYQMLKVILKHIFNVFMLK